MAKNRQFAGVARQPAQVQRGRASRYRNYGEALRDFASRLKSPEIRNRLLLVADHFSHKAASMEAKSRRVMACNRT